MLLQHKQVAIVGGGPAGLTLARLLQLQNDSNSFSITVYERDAHRDIRVQGATLDLHEGTGLEAIKRAGLLPAFYKHHRPAASKMRLVDKSLRIAFDDHDFATVTAETRPEIDRAPLRDILLDALAPGTVAWNSHFVSMEEEGKGWRLHFKKRNQRLCRPGCGCRWRRFKAAPLFERYQTHLFRHHVDRGKYLPG